MPLLLETNVTPAVVVFDETARDVEPGGLTSLIRPRITGSLPLLGSIDEAPFGEPTPGMGPVVFFSVLALAAFGAWSLVRTVARR